MAIVTLFGPGIDPKGRAYPLDDGELSLGRDPSASLVLDDREVSRRHALLRKGEAGWEAWDLGSSNGIRVNGHRLEAALLSDGDELRIGPFRIVFSGDAAEARRVVPGRRPPPLPSPPSPLPVPGTRGRRVLRSGPPSPKGGVLLAVGLALAVFLSAVLAGVALYTGGEESPGRPDASAPGPPEPTPAAPPLSDDPLPTAAAWPPPPDPSVAAEVGRAAASLERALAAANLDEVLVHVHPAAADALRGALGDREAELPRVAALLATRKLVVAAPTWAEYEVTEGGRAFAVVFEKVEGRWLLSSL